MSEQDGISSFEIEKKWKNKELTSSDIEKYIKDIRPETPELEDKHIAHNLFNLYQHIVFDKRKTHWTKAIVNGRWLDAWMRSDMALGKGWNKVMHFLYHAVPSSITYALQHGGIGTTDMIPKKGEGHRWKRNENYCWLCPDCEEPMEWTQVRIIENEGRENRIDVIECKECSILAQKGMWMYEPKTVKNEDELLGERIY